MKICLVSQNVSPGLLIFRRDLIIRLVSLGHEVYAFACDYNRDTISEVEALGAKAVQYSLAKTGLNPFLDIADCFKLRTKFKEIKPDLVFSFFVKPSLYGTLAAALANVPRRVAMLEGLGYIHTVTADKLSWKKRILRRVHGALSTFAYYFADSIIFLNDDDPRDLARVAYIDKSRIKVLGPIGLNLESFPFSEVSLSSKVRFIFIARLLKEKGVEEFIDAARVLRGKTPNVEFVVLGGLDPSNPSSITEADLDALIKENIIIYPGYVSNVVDWIKGAHVFVLPSYREGFPRSTQEAMAIGRAVITTDVPGCRDTVVNGVNGFLVQRGSSSDLIQKMLRFVDSPELITSMGLQSHKLAVERFDVHKVNNDLIRFLGV